MWSTSKQYYGLPLVVGSLFLACSGARWEGKEQLGLQLQFQNLLSTLQHLTHPTHIQHLTLPAHNTPFPQITLFPQTSLVLRANKHWNCTMPSHRDPMRPTKTKMPKATVPSKDDDPASVTKGQSDIRRHMKVRMFHIFVKLIPPISSADNPKSGTSLDMRANMSTPLKRAGQPPEDISAIFSSDLPKKSEKPSRTSRKDDITSNSTTVAPVTSKLGQGDDTRRRQVRPPSSDNDDDLDAINAMYHSGQKRASSSKQGMPDINNDPADDKEAPQRLSPAGTGHVPCKFPYMDLT